MLNTDEKVYQVPVELVTPNRFQPRLAFDDEGLSELATSIKEHGIIQPLVLRKINDKYEIIAGERRYRAALKVGLKTIPAILTEISDEESAELAIVENLQRKNLTPIEEARSFKSLLDKGYLTQEQLANKIGISQSSVANKLRLLNLTEEVQDALLQGRISERHARSLLSVPKEKQVEWLNKIINERLTVRQLDLEIKKEKELTVDVKEGDTVIEENKIEEVSVEQPVATEEIREVAEPVVENSISEVTEEKPDTRPKFFNFLEDEAANMNMGEEPVVDDSSTIETLEVLDINEPVSNTVVEETPAVDIAPVEQPVVDPQNTIEETQAPVVDVNAIEEIVPEPEKPQLINPMDSVIKLDPGFDQLVAEYQGLDLGTVINDVREFVETLKARGINVNMEELDLEGQYQFVLNVDKNEFEK